METDQKTYLAEKDLGKELRQAWDEKTKPQGSLGVLEDLAVQIGLQLRSKRPEISRPTLLIFAGDHGIAEAGVSAYFQDVTAKMVENFRQETAAATILARRLGIHWLVVDCGVKGKVFSPHLHFLDLKMAQGTKNFLNAPAMERDLAYKAYERGKNLIYELRRQGANTFLIGEMGIGNTSSAAVMSHFLTGLPLTALVGPGSGLSPEGVQNKIKILEKALSRVAGRFDSAFDPIDLLAEFGGLEIATMAGAFEACAESRAVAVADGYISTVAAALAACTYPQVLSATVWSHVSKEPGHPHLLQHLKASPLLSLGMGLGEGSGALLSLPLLQGALELFNHMAKLSDFNIEPPRRSL